MGKEIVQDVAATAKLAPMKGGGFYNNNSALQAAAIAASLPTLQEAATASSSAYLHTPRALEKPFYVVECGCSQGANSIIPVKLILEQLRSAATVLQRSPSHEAHGKQLPASASTSNHASSAPNALEVVVCHEDLPSNEFSSLLSLVTNPHTSYAPHEQHQQHAACASGHASATSPVNAGGAAPQPQLRVFPMLVGSSMYERFLPRGSFHVGFGFSAFHWLPPLDLEPERLPAEALVRVSPNAPSALSVAADSAPSEASAESTYDLGGVLPYMPHSPARPAWLQHAQASWGRWLECRAEEAAGPGASIVLAVPVFTHPRVPMPNSKASSASAEGAAESAPHSGAGADAQSDLPAELQRYAGEYIVVRDAALQAMAADGLLTARELAHMTPSAFLATPQELKAVLQSRGELWRLRHFTTKSILHPAYRMYMEGALDAAGLADVYARWWRAIAEPSFVAGLMRAQAATAAGAGVAEQQQQQQQQQQHQEAKWRERAVHLSHEALERYHAMVGARPIPMVCDYSIAWLERL